MKFLCLTHKQIIALGLLKLITEYILIMNLVLGVEINPILSKV